MPSAFAHALVGASLASASPSRGRRTLLAVALGLVAVAPDLDVIAFHLGIPYEHPLGHRGLSHSLFAAALVGMLSLPLWRRLQPDSPGIAATLTFLAVASHGLLDAFTDAGLGIGLFMPLDGGRYFAPWRPILTSPLSLGAFFSGRGLAILGNEALWVGIPCAIFLTLAASLRRIAAR